HHLANTRAPARLIPGSAEGPPVSMPSWNYDASIATPVWVPPAGRFWHAFLIPTCRISCAFSLSLTTTVFSQRSTEWFSVCPRRPTLEGQQSSISRTAPPPKVSYITPPSAFVTHSARRGA